jgi:aspartate/methionine/tyrosine aminotransferase
MSEAVRMRHPSLYLDWYVHVPPVNYDFRSSGVMLFKYDLNLGKTDLSINYHHGNPEIVRALSQMYHVKPENVFVSTEGASGQNARLIRYLAERDSKKTEAIVEYPTYEPLLRQVEDHFPKVRRLERNERDAYRLDANLLKKIVSEKTGLLVLTNPHAPSGAIADRSELKEIMNIASGCGFYVLCDEIYAEFDRRLVPTIFSVDSEFGIVTTSFTKAYGLGGLKLGVALANEQLVDEFYMDVLNTIGNSPNIVQAVAAKLLTDDREALERHKQKWAPLKEETELWLGKKGFEYFPNTVGVTYWVKLHIKDTYKWVNEVAIPRFSLAAVPGVFFLFRNGHELVRSDMMRLGLGNINSDEGDLSEAFRSLWKALLDRGFAR